MNISFKLAATAIVLAFVWLILGGYAFPQLRLSEYAVLIGFGPIIFVFAAAIVAGIWGAFGDD
jgi:hypothetical protein